MNGVAQEKQLYNDLEIKVWACARKGKNTSGAAGSDGPREVKQLA